MTMVLIFLFGGILTGFLLKDRKNLLSFLDRATLWSVFFLLFLFGIEVGTNEKIVSNFLKVGYSGIILAVGAVAGSILCMIPVYLFLFKKNPHKKNNEESL